MGNTDRLRHRLAVRDGNHCHYCGTVEPGALKKFTLDHIIPRSQGGTRIQENLVLSCYRCNHKRRDRPYLDYARDKAVDVDLRMEVWKRAVEAHSEVAGVWFPALTNGDS